jgi:sugar-specific transcriptional regulator TrmB
MHEDVYAWLINTGLSPERAQMYLALLRRGEAGASELAEDVQVKRTAAYDNLQALEKVGYVTIVKHGKRFRFIPVAPKKIYDKFEERTKELKALLPSFLSIGNAEAGRSMVERFDGKYAAREIYEDILKTAKKEYIYLSPPELTLQIVDRAYIQEWIERRVKKGIHSRSLRAPGKVIDKAPLFNDEASYLRQIRFLPSYVDLKSTVYIYAGKVAVISTKKEGGSYILHSPDLAYTLEQVFEFLWSISTRSR